MQNKSLDSLKRARKPKVLTRPKVLAPVVASYIQPARVSFAPKIKHYQFKVNWQPVVTWFQALEFKRFNLFFRQRSVPVMVVVAALIIAFSGGVWATWTTSQSSADSEVAAQAGVVPLEIRGSLGPDSSAPNRALFNLTISQLEEYFNQLAESNQREQYEEVLADRKFKLRAYLEEKGSPFTEIVDTIAELKHWKIVLAVSNSESSLGKRCYNNNCSGIGVEPGHELWRDYASKRDWAKDLDKLIEKRYKDWTLEEMNGVYNKPGSDNWVSASTQILEELGERGIQ